MKLSSYVVKHHTEEAECSHCGGPIYVGERAFHETGDEYGPVYCSKRCAAYKASDEEHARN